MPWMPECPGTHIRDRLFVTAILLILLIQSSLVLVSISGFLNDGIADKLSEKMAVCLLTL